MTLLSLLKREIRKDIFSAVVVNLLTLVFYIMLYIRITSRTLPVILMVIYIPLFMFPLYLLFLAYRMFSIEWKENTIFILKSLPRSGYEIVFAKMLKAILILLVFFMVSGSGIFFIISSNYNEIVELMPSEVNYLNWSSLIFWFILVYFWICGFVYFAVQISELISTVFDRFRWLITVVVFYLIYYLVLRLGGYVFLLFSWLPDIKLNLIKVSGNNISPLSINSGGLATGLLILIILFYGCGLIYEKVLEV
ncbi:MAG: hypothetical protein ACOCQS_01215 [Bacillota bacterium]